MIYDNDFCYNMAYEYKYFESNAIDGQHVSDNIDFTEDGLILKEYSGFNTREPPATIKFRDNFQSTSRNSLL
ncbi:unnamed protein product [marine sediment metagenome]|uniref:Uncharacterized protein n=1 Tax=marine sediment metagenome TaxID=412755 RepID=X1B3X7_9ZZZZ